MSFEPTPGTDAAPADETSCGAALPAAVTERPDAVEAALLSEQLQRSLDSSAQLEGTLGQLLSLLA